MKKIPLLFCLVVFLAAFASAQTDRNANCPVVEVTGGSAVEIGAPLSFTVNVKDYDLSKVSYKWTVSNGTIVEGGETPNITIDVSKLPDGTNITATVEVKGLPEGCPNTASETGGVICRCIPAQLMDEFSNLPNGEIKARLDEYYTALGKQPNAQGYIINYGMDREIARREALIKKHIALRKYDVSRITFIRGGIYLKGEGGSWTRLWLVPPGATPPTPEDGQ